MYTTVSVPAEMPVTTPVIESIVAEEVDVLVKIILHVPPVMGSLKVSAEPTHKVVLPVIGLGCGTTVTIRVAIQPAGEV